MIRLVVLCRFSSALRYEIEKIAANVQCITDGERRLQKPRKLKLNIERILVEDGDGNPWTKSSGKCFNDLGSTGLYLANT